MTDRSSATLHSRWPARRTSGLSVQTIGSEILVYDEATHKAFCLNAVAAAVWTAADGSRSRAEIARAAGLSMGATGLLKDGVVPVEAVDLALAQLHRDGLLMASPGVPPPVVSRRAALARLGAGAALMVPAIAVIAAPKAAQAYSGCVNCTNIAPGPLPASSHYIERPQPGAAARTEQRQISIQQALDSNK